MELLQGIDGSEILRKDWAVQSVAINVTHLAHWKVTAGASERCAHRTCFPTSSPIYPLVPMASDPGSGPRKDTGVYKSHGWFVCMKLMACSNSLFWGDGNGIPKKPWPPCALCLVQEYMLGQTVLGFLQTVLAARLLPSLLHDSNLSPSPPAGVPFTGNLTHVSRPAHVGISHSLLPEFFICTLHLLIVPFILQ